MIGRLLYALKQIQINIIEYNELNSESVKTNERKYSKKQSKKFQKTNENNLL